MVSPHAYEKFHLPLGHILQLAICARFRNHPDLRSVFGQLGARAQHNGALYIERPDMLAQLAKQKGLSHPVIDGMVALVHLRLAADRKKAA